jgi:hypothetical protein
MTLARAYTTQLRPQTCCQCGIHFATPSDFQSQRQRDGATFYCPNGHGQAYTETTEQRLKRELAEAHAYNAQTRTQLAAEKKQHAATKGQATRLRNRAQAGMCAECRRVFQNYARHMETEHAHANLTY